MLNLASLLQCIKLYTLLYFQDLDPKSVPPPIFRTYLFGDSLYQALAFIQAPCLLSLVWDKWARVVSLGLGLVGLAPQQWLRNPSFSLLLQVLGWKPYLLSDNWVDFALGFLKVGIMNLAFVFCLVLFCFVLFWNKRTGLLHYTREIPTQERKDVQPLGSGHLSLGLPVG